MVGYISTMEEKKALLRRFGLHVKQLRTEKGITGAELARRCDMDKPNMARIERGETNPTLVTLMRIALALNISLEVLFKGFDLEAITTLK